MEKLFDLKTAAEFVFSQASDDLVYLILIEKYIEIKRGKIEDHGGGRNLLSKTTRWTQMADIYIIRLKSVF